MKTQLCNLRPPADCKHRIDGKLSHTTLCGCNPLNEECKFCPYKQEATIIVDAPEYNGEISTTIAGTTYPSWTYVYWLEDQIGMRDKE